MRRVDKKKRNKCDKEKERVCVREVGRESEKQSEETGKC